MDSLHKELHLAESIETLDKIANNNETLHLRKPASLMSIAKKLYIKSQSDPLDEEVTYILLTRFTIVYNKLMVVHTDQNFVQMMLGKEERSVKSQLVDLTRSLKDRYQEAQKINSINKTVSETSISRTSSNPIFDNSLFITCSQLFQVYRTKRVKILVLDARSETDFKESHIKDMACINIPDSCIQAGLSAHRLEESLPAESLEEWKSRDEYDVVVLVDWSTTQLNYKASKLDKLRKILVHWDVNRSYNERPVILKDGYKEWLEVYPMLCTHANIIYSRANKELDDILNLDDVEYPSGESKSHEVFNRELSEKAAPAQRYTKSRDEILEEEVEVIEMNTEVTKELLQKEKEWAELHTQIKQESDGDKLADLKKAEQETEDRIAALAAEEANLIKKKSQLVSDFNLAAGFKPSESPPNKNRVSKLRNISKLEVEHLDMVKVRETFAVHRQQLLDDARQSKKPKINLPDVRAKPKVDRAIKPATMHLPVVVKHMDGKVRAVQDGFTGLINIRNTCYMNTIIQCLRHIPEILNYYCNGDYVKHLHKSPPVITNEFAHLIRALWSNAYRTIRPTEFYNKLTQLAPLYREGQHEDCLEFFIHLFTLLNEDCAIDITSKPFWSETQLAWFKLHNGKVSFYINIFYHQIRLDLTCPSCKLVSVKFDIENVFYLPIPAENFTLEECMQKYLHNQDVLQCRKCRTPYKVSKSIVYYPSILIVALKRHVPDCTGPTIVYQKNKNECTFPVDDFRFGNSVYTLRAIALHVGGVNTGHYTAVCRNPNTDRWICYNDDLVSEVNINDPTLKSKAYAFFYTLKITTGAKTVSSQETFINTTDLEEDSSAEDEE